MSGSSHSDPVPRSATDDERLAARRSVSARLELVERLRILDDGVPGAAAVQSAKRLLEKGAPSPETVADLRAQQNADGSWSFDHAAAMRLWAVDEPGSRDDRTDLPPRELLDAFLDNHAERTGDDSERAPIERLHAEAMKEDAEGALPEITTADAAVVAEQYGYGEYAGTVDLAPASLLRTLFSRRPPDRTGPRLFLYTGGVVAGIGGALDAYAWHDLELHDHVETVGTGIEYRSTPRRTLLLGPAGRNTQFIIPSADRGIVLELARNAGATIS